MGGNKVMGFNKPRPPFGQSRFNNEFVPNQQKFNKFEGYKGGYGAGDGAGEDFLADNYNSNRHFNNQQNNRFDHANPKEGAPAQPFVQGEAIDATQYESGMIPGFRMIPKMTFEGGAQIPPFQPFGEFLVI